MNSKQRKTAEKMRQRALLDADAKVRELEEKRRLFAAERDMENIRMENQRKNLAADQQDHKERCARFLDDMEADRRKFLATCDMLSEANVVREVLLLLELDEEPSEIALKIRSQFGLLVPEW
ncbi:hypothetical protein phiK7B1_077 [Pseudomonas phage phiK7B1]|nr:hypothetical protein phiK7B1_077 [Pseudomonas phage phiK7B1]